MAERRFSFILYLPWAIIAAALPVMVYWQFESMPITIQYTAPYFSSEPARTRDAANSSAVVQAPGGATLYRYVEYCVHRTFVGRIQRAWVGSAIVWPAPDVSTATSDDVGCFARPMAVEVPTSSPTRNFQYVQRMYVQVNKMRTEPIEYPPIPLRILSPEDVKAAK